MAGIAELLPAAAGDVDGPVSGTVFKIERGASGEKIAYVRMFSGTVRTRDRLRLGDDSEGKVTAISVFDRGSSEQRAAVSAGEIGKLWGLGEVRIGDRIGEAGTAATRHRFAPPTLESAVVPAQPRGQARAPRRARPAGRAGPAHQRATGRHARRSSRSRSTARCRRR